jgi:hypothetical protein
MPNSAQTPIQLTYPLINTTPTNTQQYSFVAGPFIIYGGSINNPTNGQVITLLPTSNLLYVGLTASIKNVAAKTNRAPAATNINSPPSNFTINFDTFGPFELQTIYYLAIGQ